MSVIDIAKDTDTRTLTVTAEFAVPVERVWQLWADPRQLERWWGPPSYPATVVDHDLRPGGTVSYYMTGPEGDRPHGYWRVLAVEAPHRLELEDGFADEAGVPNPELPTTTMHVTIEAQDDVTRMAIRSTFPSLEAMEQMVAMGMMEGLREALSQIDGILAEAA